LSRRDKGIQTAMENSKVYMHYFNRLYMLALSMFKWNNLPPTVNPIYLERKLLTKGKMLFFLDDLNELRALDCTLTGPLDLNDEPIVRTAFAPSGYYSTYNKENSVICYNNVMRTSSLMDVQMYAEKLWRIDTTSEINLNAQKMPIIVTGTESQINTLKNVAMNYDNFCHYIFGDSEADLHKAISVLETKAPYLCDKFQELKTQVWNEALTTFGISNINLSKKERLVSNEVDINMGGVIAQQYLRLEPRELACQQMSELLGVDITVEYRNEIFETSGGETNE
jgi:hypothetical protein